MPATTQRKATRQRAAVASWLDEQDTFRSAQEIYAELRSAGESVGLATVYRTLQTMVEDGEVDVLRTDDGEAVYRRCSTGHHHHHLVCRVCGRTVEVQDRPVERWAARIAAEHGFSEVEHQVEVFGVCGRCADS
ncbi:MAG: Fur family transcriptional regulator [Actinomycetota bacterium]